MNLLASYFNFLLLTKIEKSWPPRVVFGKPNVAVNVLKQLVALFEIYEKVITKLSQHWCFIQMFYVMRLRQSPLIHK